MPLQPQDIAASYPLPAYNFRVTVDGEGFAFAEVSGLAVERETVTYRHGLSNWEGERIVRFAHDKFQPVIFKRGARRNNALLYDWLEAQEPKPVEVSLCDEQGLPVLTWRILRALPVKLSAPTFDAAGNEVAVETLEVMASGVTLERRT